MIKNRLAKAFMCAWMQRGWLAHLAWPLAQLFGVVIRLRSFLYQIGWLPQHKLPVPVIVVGNIFVGGTGKTPFTLWLLKALSSRGYIPGVISRGYGSKLNAPRVVTVNTPISDAGDEPVLLAQQSGSPVVVGRNRFEAGLLLLATFPEVNLIIADDGLQHLALARDVEIMLFDARGVGNGWLLPAGPLREPMSRPRDVTVVNLNAGEKINAGVPFDAVRMQIVGTRARQLSDPNRTQPITHLISSLSLSDRELNIVAAAGIGHPERFFGMLRLQGVQCSPLPLPDHFNYLSNPFKGLIADIILITEKDAVKCRQIEEIAADSRIWVVEAEVDIDTLAIEKILNVMNKAINYR